MEHDYVFKIISIGNTNVGKTQILNSYTQKFQKDVKPTVGINDAFKIIKMDDNVVKFIIWDISGNEKLKISKIFYDKIDGAFIVYDITNRKSFESVDKWFKELKDQDSEIIFIGNKNDLDYDRKIEYDEEYQKAQKYNVLLFDVSAFTKKNIDTAFKNLFDSIYQKFICNKSNDSITIELDKNFTNNMMCC